MTISALSASTGITPANLSNIINEKASPRLEILERIAEALEIEPYLLLKEETKGNENSSTIVCPHCGKVLRLQVQEQ